MALADPRLDVRRNVPLAPLSTLGVGGAARFFMRATSTGDVAAAHEWATDSAAGLLVLGGGSNLVVADAGFDGLVLQVALSGLEWAADGGDCLVVAGAGESWDGVVATVVERDLAGLECLSGIPGTVGGTPVQNVGAYGQEVAQTISHVIAFDRETSETRTLTNTECGFSYRASRFKGQDAGRFIVCGVAFRLRGGPPVTAYPDVRAQLALEGHETPTLADVRSAVLAVRRRKGMVIDHEDPDTRGVGSFFVNPVVTAERYERLLGEVGRDAARGFVLQNGDVKVPAAWLIECAGFSRGQRSGAVGLSSKHPLAIINRGGASARDVVRLAATIKRRVAVRCGVWLQPEPVFVGFEGDPDVEYLQGVRN